MVLQEWGSFEGPFGWLALVSGALEHFPPFLISVVRFLGFWGLGFALLFISYLYLTATCAGEVSVDSSAARALVLQQNYTKSASPAACSL